MQVKHLFENAAISVGSKMWIAKLEHWTLFRVIFKQAWIGADGA